jgi:hypothetical protein
MKLNNRILFLGLCLIIFIILIVKAFYEKEEGYRRRRRGPFIDQACVENDCSTEEGKKLASEMCQKAFEKSPGYNFLKSACSSQDPEIKKYSCPESCDPLDVSAFVEFKGKATLPSCVNDPAHPEKSVDGTTYCWSNNQDYIVKPKNVNSGTAALSNMTIPTLSGLTLSSPFQTTTNSAPTPPATGSTTVVSSASPAPATGIIATSARLRYY